MQSFSEVTQGLSIRGVLAPWLLVVAFASICFVSQLNKSVSVDEFCHFPSGIYNLISLDWRMNRESPPLVKGLPALTALITKPNLNVKGFVDDPNPWRFGYDFMFGNAERYQYIFSFARSVVILMGCLTGLVLFRFAKELYGNKGGLLTLFLFVFYPNIIAHARLATIDMGATCMMLLSIYSLWKFLKRPGATRAVVAGCALGLAQLSKFTALILYPIFFVIILVVGLRASRFSGSQARGRERATLPKAFGGYCMILLVSMVVINGGIPFFRILYASW